MTDELRKRCCKNFPKFSLISIFFNCKAHADLPSGAIFKGFPKRVDLNGGYRAAFNAREAKVKRQLLNECVTAQSFEATVALCFAIRALQCGLAWKYGWAAGLASGLLHFVVAPLSLPICLAHFGTVFYFYFQHYAIQAVVVAALRFVGLRGPTVKFSAMFLAAFFAMDFAVCLYVYCRMSERVGPKRLAWSIAYGTLNTKTYFVLIFGCLCGLEVDLLVWAVTGALCLITTKRLPAILSAAGCPCAELLFYVEHRIAHLPVLYPQTHKMHHYLHDTTPWDAHPWGIGMNEEHVCIWFEVLPCVAFGAFPFWLNGVSLFVSIFVGKGAHTRHPEDIDPNTCLVYDIDNFHADHHLLHRSNYGQTEGALLDFYFGTNGPETTSAMGWVYLREDQPDGTVTIHVRKIVEGERRATSAADAAAETPSTAKLPATPAPLVGAAAKVVTLRELRNCTGKGGQPLWIAMYGVVFDLTAFAPMHPGGMQILQSHAGSDATETFEEIGHSEKAFKLARKYAIGVLEGAKPSPEMQSLSRDLAITPTLLEGAALDVTVDKLKAQ